MSKKIILLTLAAASVAAFVLPATAMAVEEDVPLHMVPAPVGVKTVDGEGESFLKGGFGTIKTTSWSGTATFTSSTTGTIVFTWKGFSSPTGTCTTAGQPAGTVVSTELPFHLVTVRHEHNAAITGPGVLITPNAATGAIAHFDCPLFPNTTITGNGLVGTITNPACNASSKEPTISFTSKSAGVQTHTTVVSTNAGVVGATPTSYGLQAFGGPASLDASGKITLGTEAKLECT